MALLSLFRLVNCFLAAFSVWVGAFTSGREQIDVLLGLACLAAFLLTAAGNITNDIADQDADRLQKTDRALVSGRISPALAWMAASLLFLAGIGSGFLADMLHGWIAVGVGILLLTYNFLLKKVPVAGNAAVAFLSAMTFVYGGVFTPHWKRSLIPFAFAFLIHLGRETLKSIEDREADTACGVRTLAAYVPAGGLRTWIAGLWGTTLALALIPFFTGWYGLVYLVLLISCVFIPFAFLFRLLFQPDWLSKMTKLHSILKIAMLGGTIAILMAR